MKGASKGWHIADIPLRKKKQESRAAQSRRDRDKKIWDTISSGSFQILGERTVI
jgi:hypothetical protein